MSEPVTDLGMWALPVAFLGGAIRVSTPYLYVSLGECITERSGRVNLGLEGTLVMGAMTGYFASWLTGTPWADEPTNLMRRRFSFRSFAVNSGLTPTGCFRRRQPLQR
jgi:hypothetical protein